MKKYFTALSLLLLAMAACQNNTAPPTSDANGKTQEGQGLYPKNCAICHGADGKFGFNGAKDLTTSTLDKAAIIELISNGKGKMPPYKGTLSDKDIALIADFVLTLRQ